MNDEILDIALCEKAFAALHETMEALHDIGAIRAREHVSQPVFARYLNVSKNLVSDWERGVKKPGGPALRLLAVVQKKGLAAIA